MCSPPFPVLSLGWGPRSTELAIHLDRYACQSRPCLHPFWSPVFLVEFQNRGEFPPMSVAQPPPRTDSLGCGSPPGKGPLLGPAGPRSARGHLSDAPGPRAELTVNWKVQRRGLTSLKGLGSCDGGHGNRWSAPRPVKSWERGLGRRCVRATTCTVRLFLPGRSFPPS